MSDRSGIYQSPLATSSRMLGSPSPSRRVNDLADEDSLSMLKSQISQVRSMKIDCDRKDQLIAEQRQQIADLSRFRDQFYQIKAQLSLTEEKVRLTEVELQAKNSSLEDKIRELDAIESSLRKQLVSLERERFDESRNLKGKVSEVESELASVRAEIKRIETKQRTTQYELEMSQQAVAATRTTHKEREDNLNQTIRRLQESFNSISADKRKVQEDYQSLCGENEALKADLSRRESEVALLERLRQEDAQVIQAQRRDISELEDKLRSVSAEAAQVPLQRSELRTLQNLLAETQANLDRERNSRRMLDEVKKRVEELNTELEEYHSPTRSPLRSGRF